MPFLTDDSLVNMLQTQFGGVATTAPAEYQVAVVTVAPTDEDGTGLGEPEDSGYSRITVANNTTNFVVDTDPNLAIVNGTPWTFAAATTEWGAALGLALYRPGSPETFLGFVEFANPRVISTGDVLAVPAQAFRLNLDLTPMSAYVQEHSQMLMITAPNGNRYAIQVSNTGGLSAKAMGSIAAPPPPPPTFTYDTGTRTFTWTAPSYYSPPITSFTLWQTTDGDGSFEILAQDATTYVLPTGVTGTFYLTADNPAGSSVPSNSINVF